MYRELQYSLLKTNISRIFLDRHFQSNKSGVGASINDVTTGERGSVYTIHLTLFLLNTLCKFVFVV